jgi:hypothetical protein
MHVNAPGLPAGILSIWTRQAKVIINYKIKSVNKFRHIIAKNKDLF